MRDYPHPPAKVWRALTEPALVSLWTATGAGGRPPHEGGTRFTYEHTGFTGVGGVVMAKLLGRVRRKMLTVGLPPVLDDLDDDGVLRLGSTLKPKSLS